MESDHEIPQEILTQVSILQTEVGRQAEAIAKRLGPVLVCQRGCHGCCEDDLTVFPVEAEIILRHCGPLLTFDQPHPTGKCAFLDAQGGCRIYPWRPYVCRTQGLPLQWVEIDEDGSELDMRDICPLNLDEMMKQGVALEDISTEDCWALGSVESTLAGLQVQAQGGFQENLERVFLRDLFKSQSS